MHEWKKRIVEKFLLENLMDKRLDPDEVIIMDLS
jgi:hypothetical protein